MLTGPERDITVSHLDGDLSADDREELAGLRRRSSMPRPHSAGAVCSSLITK